MVISAVARMACAAVVVAAGMLVPGTTSALADPSTNGPIAGASAPTADAAAAIDSAASLPLPVTAPSAAVPATLDCALCGDTSD